MQPQTQDKGKNTKGIIIRHTSSHVTFIVQRKLYQSTHDF